MEDVTDRVLDLVLVQLLMKIFPDLLVVMVMTGEEMIHCFVGLPAGWACSHLRSIGGLVTVIERKPLMDKFGYNSTIGCFKLLESKSYS